MDIQGVSSIKDFILHIGQMVTMWQEAEETSLWGETDEARETAAIRANACYEHIEDDLLFFGRLVGKAMIQTVSAN